MLRLLIYVMIAYIVWKIVRIVVSSRGSRFKDSDNPPPEFPQDTSYKHIEDADFEDISSDPDKPS